MISRNISFASSRDFPACLLKYVTTGCRRNKDIYIHSIYCLVINERLDRNCWVLLTHPFPVVGWELTDQVLRDKLLQHLGEVEKLCFVLLKPHPVNQRSQLESLFKRALVVATQVLWELLQKSSWKWKKQECDTCLKVPQIEYRERKRDFHLEVMENRVGHGIFAWNGVGPQFLHVKHLIGQWRHRAYRMNWSINTSHVFTLKILVIFMKNKQSPSFTALAFLIQSVRCRTKSKKKSPSGTLITWNVLTQYW